MAPRCGTSTFRHCLIFGRELNPAGVCALKEPDRNWTGAPRSPKRTWAENDMFRSLFAVRFRKKPWWASPVFFGPRTLRRTWGTRPVLLGSVRRLTPAGLKFTRPRISARPADPGCPRIRWQETLEVQPESRLSSTVSGVLSSLRACQRSEGRTVDRGDGRGKVGVVEYIGKGRFEARMKFLRDAKLLSYPKRDCRGSRSLQNANAGVSEAPCARGGGGKCGQVEVPRPRLASVEIVRHCIGPRNRTAIDQVSI